MIEKELSRYYIRILEKVKSVAGFTFIEILVVITVISILSGIGIAGFVSFSRSQTLNTAVNDVISVLNLAKSRSGSQVKPDYLCLNTDTLSGYEVKISVATPNYEMDVRCTRGGISLILPPVLSKKLPNGYSFDSTSGTSFFFPLLIGGVVRTGGTTIIIKDAYGSSKTITVDASGNITVSN